MEKSVTDSTNRREPGSPRQYTRVARALHWLIAAALFAQIGFGWFLNTIPRGGPARGFYVNLHKSTGLTLALLILIRIAWRLLNPAPRLPACMPSWEQRTAHWNHGLLYVCMLGMPLSGYVASNFSKHGVKLFNLVMLPPWGIDSPQVYAIFNTTHIVLSYLLVALIVVHVMAAIRHAIRGDGIVSRIWLTSKR